MKKPIGKLTILTLSVISLCISCGGPRGTKAASETLKIVLWDKAQTSYIDPMVNAWKAKHPGVNVEFVDFPANEYGDKLAIMMSGGDDSDIISIKDVPMYASMASKKQIDSLTPLIARDGVDLVPYSGMTNEITVDGQLYALPFRNDIWILYYNKDVFDKAGIPYPTNDMTWQQFAKLAKKLSSGSGIDRVYGAFYHTWRSTVELPAVQDGKHTIISTDYRFMKPYYEMVRTMENEKTIPDYSSLKVGNIHYSGYMYNGQAAMLPMGSWFIGTLISKIRDGTTNIRWGIVKYPHPEGVEAGTTAGTITSLALNARSKHKELAWDFIKFFCGTEGAELLAKNGSIPAIRNATVLTSLSKMDGFPSDPASAQALETIQVRLELPLNPQVAKIEQILKEEHDLIMVGGNIDEGLANMGRRVKELLEK